MSEPAVLTEVRDGVLLVTLNRPEQRNAVNRAVAEGIAARSSGSTQMARCGSACSPAPARASAPGWT